MMIKIELDLDPNIVIVIIIIMIITVQTTNTKTKNIAIATRSHIRTESPTDGISTIGLAPDHVIDVDIATNHAIIIEKKNIL